jgi:Na+-driven multidrug efflux pump
VIRKVGRESLLSLVAWLTVVSLGSALAWPYLAAFFSESNEAVRDLSTTMFAQLGWIFLVFSANNAMDSLFFGTGVTSYVFYQSLLTNLIVYLVPWILYGAGVLEPTYSWVYGLYIAGMLIDFALTMFFAIRLWKSLSEE